MVCHRRLPEGRAHRGTRAMSKRKIFDEMMEGVRAMKSHREGKITLRTYNVEAAPLPKVDSKLIRDTRKRLHCSRAVFARKLRINERTLEKWEHGRAKPNPQAAMLHVRNDCLRRREFKTSFLQELLDQGLDFSFQLILSIYR
jgi:putative transcriptional regulator